MAITEKDVEAQAGDVAKRIREAERSRLAGMDWVQELQQAKAEALRVERVRLLHRFGERDDRVVRISARIESARAQQQALHAESQRSTIAAPRRDAAAAIVHGRVVDAADSGMAGMTVRARYQDDSKELGKAATDDVGHFVLSLPPRRPEDTEVAIQLEVLSGNNRVTYRDTEARLVAVGEVAYTEIAIVNRATKPPEEPVTPARSPAPPRPRRPGGSAAKKR